MRFCPKCGKKIDNDLTECPYCGFVYSNKKNNLFSNIHEKLPKHVGDIGEQISVQVKKEESYIKSRINNESTNLVDENEFFISKVIFDGVDHITSKKQERKLKKELEKEAEEKKKREEELKSQKIKEENEQKIQSLRDNAYNYFNNNDFDKAHKYFIKLNNATPDLNDEDYYTWGLCLDEKGVKPGAYKKFKKANEINPCDKYLDKINSIEQEGDILIKKATQSYTNKKYDESNNYFLKASNLKLNSFTAENYYIWGLCLMKLGDGNGAKSKFKKAKSLDYKAKYVYAYENELENSSNIELLIHEATLCYNKEFYGDALKYVDKVLELDSENVSALLLKGDILSEQNLDEKIYYEKVLEIDPHNERAKFSLSVIEMVEDLQNPEKPSYWLNKGYNETLKGNYLNAKDAINKAIEMDPDNYVAWSRLCVIYQNLKDYPNALDAINRSLEIYSESAQSWFNKGQTLFWLGNFNESIQCFDKAIEMDPNECDDALAIKGMALIRLNRMSEAKDSLRKSLERNPTNKLALETIKHIPNFVEIEASTIDIIGGASINVNPLWLGKSKYTLDLVNQLKEKGVNISLEVDSEMHSLLKHDSKEYFFNPDEIDGAVVYVTKLWEYECK